MTARYSDPDFPESQPELFPQCMTGARTLRPLRFRILREAQLTTRGRGLTDAPNFRVARHSSGKIAARSTDSRRQWNWTTNVRLR
jgi:hypothetical protein